MTAKRGAAAGLSGATMEHYKVVLDDDEALHLFTHAVNLLATATVPDNILECIRLARLTALQKPGGGVCGIATGDSFRRLTSRALARHYASTFEEATRPYQFALQTRAGTDCLAGFLRAATDRDRQTTVVSLDGRSAYDRLHLPRRIPYQNPRSRTFPPALRPRLLWPPIHLLLMGRGRHAPCHPARGRLRTRRCACACFVCFRAA